MEDVRLLEGPGIGQCRCSPHLPFQVNITTAMFSVQVSFDAFEVQIEED